MKWLLWRDYRLNRPILITGLALLILPYAIALLIFLWPSPNDGSWSREDNSGYGNTPEVLAALAMYSLGISQLTVAVLGGNAIAGERLDRSAEFMIYLPWKRAARVFSKLLLAAIAVLIIWIPNIAVMMVSRMINSPFKTAFNPDGLGFALMAIAISGLTFFGVGWFLSSVQSSPTYAVAGALLLPLVIMVSITLLWELKLIGEEAAEYGYLAICPVVAACSLVIGIWHFLRRVEP